MSGFRGTRRKNPKSARSARVRTGIDQGEMNWAMMTESLIGTLIGVVVGSAATILVSRFYYKRTTADLREQSLKHLAALEEAGLVKMVRKMDGTPTGGIEKSGEVDIDV